MRIGLVGTGTLGAPIEGCLIRAGHALSIYDCCPEATATPRA
jgi:3-hydroxyisobutyrate dehydrogenase-like beta-hydroxyacid dehydrogenase